MRWQLAVLIGVTLVVSAGSLAAQQPWCVTPTTPAPGPTEACGSGCDGCCGSGTQGGNESGSGSGPARQSGATESEDSGGSGTAADCRVCKGSPVFTSSGSYQTAATDLWVRTPGFPLAAARSYLSGRAADGPLGIGWSTSVVARLYYAAYLYSAPSTYRLEAIVIMPDGARRVYVDNGDGTWTPPVGRHDTFVRNPDQTFDLTIQRSRTRFHFSAAGSLASLTDEFGNTLNYSYDVNGRVQQVADASGSGRYLTVTWGADGRISTVQDNTGRTVHYTYTNGTLTTVTDPASRVTTYGYVAGRQGQLLNQVIDSTASWNAVVTTVTYDTLGRVSTYTDRGDTYTYNYNTGTPLTASKTNLAGHQWQFTYLASGLITDRKMMSLGAIGTHTDYSADYSVQQQTDGVGVKTYFVYDAQGNPSQVTRDYTGSLAVRYDYAYDPTYTGKVVSIVPKDPASGQVDPDWQAWQYDYYQTGSTAPGALHHVFRVERDGTTLDTMATYEYNLKGQITRLTSSNGGVTDYLYDAQGNLQTVTAPANNSAGTRPVTTYGYDSLGRVLSVTDALGHQTAYTYDNDDRILTVTLPKPSSGSSLTFTTTYSYDNLDVPTGLMFTTATDPNGLVTKQGYDQFGQLNRAVDALLNVTVYAYTRGYLTSITDANNNITSYGYDNGNRLSRTTFADGSYETYSYNADDTLSSKFDRARFTVGLAYDHLKRLVQRDAAQTVRYTFTGQALTQVVHQLSPDETTLLGYDSSYRLASETAGLRGTITYLYTGAADDSMASYSVQSGPSATYTYYPDGSLQTLVWSPVSGSFGYTYTLTGQYQSVAFPSGASRNYSYDDQGRLLSLANLAPGGGNLATYAYGYDFDYTNGLYDRKGQRTSMSATVPAQGLNAHVFAYEYDPLYQLTKVTYPNVSPFAGEIDSWTYDWIGNRLTNTVNGSTQTYTYQKIGANPLNWQRLLNDGVNAYTYDAYGDVKTRTGYTFNWDIENRLTSITGTATYIYDYQNRRTSRTVGSTTNTFLYDGLNLLREQGASSADYVFGPGIDEPLAMSRGGQIYYYVADGLGSVTEVTNSAGTVQNAYLYDAWGQVRSQIGSLANPFGYTARELGEAGLDFYRARYYQPSVGRFLSEDPVGRGLESLFTDASSYSYGGNSPIMVIDPEGLEWVYKNNKVPRITNPEGIKFMNCLDKCIGSKAPLVVTSTTDPPHQDWGHAAGTSYDVRPPVDVTPKKFWCCSAQCGSKYGIPEGNGEPNTKYTSGANYHNQLRPRNTPPTIPSRLPSPCPAKCED